MRPERTGAEEIDLRAMVEPRMPSTAVAAGARMLATQVVAVTATAVTAVATVAIRGSTKYSIAFYRGGPMAAVIALVAGAAGNVMLAAERLAM